MIVQEGDRIRADVGASVTAYIEGTVVGAEQNTGYALIETEQGGAVFLPPEKIEEVLDRAGPDPETVKRARGCMMAVLDATEPNGERDI